MNPEMLLREFDRASEAPDAMTRLRAFFLELAVRGHLSKQCSDDDSSLELLRRARPAAYIDAVSGPFEIPNSWVWMRFSDITEFSAGRTPSRNDPTYWNTGDYAWTSIADMPDGGAVTVTKETVSQKAKDDVFRAEPAPVGTMIMSFKLTIGKIARLAVPSYHNEAIISIHLHVPEMDPYLFLALPERARRGATKGAIKGATLNRNSLSELLIPLPPMQEQGQIVNKVNELMDVCDELEMETAIVQSVQSRLLDALLHQTLDVDL